MSKIKPSTFYTILAVILLATLVGLSLYLKIKLWYACLISISVVTFLFYGYDKRRAIGNRGRVPEAVLHLLALAGGSLGAILGMLTFKHKTRKLFFKLILAAIVIAQATATYYFVLQHKSN